jgi:sugar phosphate permease
MKISQKNSKQEFEWKPVFYWFLGAAFFFFEYFARVDPSGMLEQIKGVFKLNHFQLGELSAFFYLPYVVMQIPVGTLVDRHGPRRWLAVAALVSAGGALLFSQAHFFWLAKWGRFLIGLGASFAFVGTLKLATIWFDKKHLGLLAGMTQGVGMLGAAVGVGSMPWLVSTFGWRDVMAFVGWLLMAFAVMIFIFIRENPQQSSSRAFDPKSEGGVKRSAFFSVARVMKSKMSWLNALYAGFLYAPTAALGELWGTQFFYHIDHFSKIQSGELMAFIFIGWTIGSPLAGWMSDRYFTRRQVMVVSSLVSLAALLLVLFLQNSSFYVIAFILFVYGLFNIGVAISYAVAGELHGTSLSGISIAFTNMLSILIGGALLQPLMGWVLDRMLLHFSGCPDKAYWLTLWILPLCLFFSLICVLLLRESKGDLNE